MLRYWPSEQDVSIKRGICNLVAVKATARAIGQVRLSEASSSRKLRSGDMPPGKGQ